MQGTLLTDPKAMLIQQPENAQLARQLRYKNLHEITEHKEHIVAFIEEAIRIDADGIKRLILPITYIAQNISNNAKEK